MKRKHTQGKEEIVFVVCQRRKSRPMVSPVVCEKRCPRRKNCRSYHHFLQPGLFDPMTLRQMKRR